MNSYFNSFIGERLTLSQKDISNSVKSREWLINGIIKKIADSPNNPQLYKEGDKPYITFGSYFKGTKVTNVDEFDIMLIIDSNTGRFTVDEKKKGDGVGIQNPNRKYDDRFKNEDGYVNPTKLLNWLKVIINEVIEPYGCEPAIRDGQAITAYIKSKDVKIDFVPGSIFKDVNTGEIFYTIPGGTESTWIQTNPRIDKEIVNAYGSRYGQFKNSIRLIKYMFKERYKINVGSYAIECAHVSFIRSNKFNNDFEYDFPNVLKHIKQLLKNGNIPDMRDSNINLAEKILNKDVCINKIDSILERYSKLDSRSSTIKQDIFNLIDNN